MGVDVCGGCSHNMGDVVVARQTREEGEGVVGETHHLKILELLSKSDPVPPPMLPVIETVAAGAVVYEMSHGSFGDPV